jgi:uncharacterized membrane protein
MTPNQERANQQANLPHLVKLPRSHFFFMPMSLIILLIIILSVSLFAMPSEQRNSLDGATNFVPLILLILFLIIMIFKLAFSNFTITIYPNKLVMKTSLFDQTRTISFADIKSINKIATIVGFGRPNSRVLLYLKNGKVITLYPHLLQKEDVTLLIQTAYAYNPEIILDEWANNIQKEIPENLEQFLRRWKPVIFFYATLVVIGILIKIFW